MRHVVVMVTSSYPRFRGDSVGTFMEPIATSVAALGHEVHVVAPWHPLVQRQPEEHGVRFHFYKYAPVPSLNIFGYAAAMRADVRLRGAAYAAAPLALGAGWWAARQVARAHNATVMHGHWVIPGGVTAALAAPELPLVISLHGSDVFIAERLRPARHAARAAFRRAGAVTACSADLAERAVRLGAARERTSVVPYGVDAARFQPDAGARDIVRQQLGIPAAMTLVAAAGRLVRKKGFEYLIDAVRDLPHVVLALAGDGTLREELRMRAASAGASERIRLMGNQTQDEVARLFAAADLIVAPSVRDDAGNVDGLPNVVMEALASGVPLITTSAGGIGSVVEHGVTGWIVPERDPSAIVSAVESLREDTRRRQIGAAARRLVQERFGWQRTAASFIEAYTRALATKSRRR